MQERIWTEHQPEFESDDFARDMMTCSPWSGHRYFAYDYICSRRPGVIVELGSYYGCSSFAFLQAVKDEDLDTHFYAVDTWRGDFFTKQDYQEDIYGTFRRIAGACFYRQNLTMLRMSFDRALELFPDHSIDLLHIDGSHRYEDVRHDFLLWKRKVKREGAVFFHDISQERLFGQQMGSARFWKELERSHDFSLSFPFSFGLGVLLFDEEVYRKMAGVIDFSHYQRRANEDADIMKDRIRKNYFQIRDQQVYIAKLQTEVRRMEQEYQDSRLLSRSLSADMGKALHVLSARSMDLQQRIWIMREEIQPLLSIIVPVYNTEQYFDRCMQSLLGQSYRNLEIIVVNDGSAGDIKSRIRRYMADPRVRFLENGENQGLFRARFHGADQARGAYLAFVDSDDYVSMDFYRNLLSKAQSRGTEIVIGPAVREENGRKWVYNYHQDSFHFDYIEGRQVKEHYFGQELYCYSWHTVWNKIYSRALWDRCRGEFACVDRHLVMTEDILFSSVLFFEAGSAAAAENEAYFYCQHEHAATAVGKMTYCQYEKHILDMTFVFDHIEDYLQRRGADERIRRHFQNGRRHYGRMWEELAQNTFSADCRQKALSLLDRFCPDRGGCTPAADHFFESIRTVWRGGFEYIKCQIAQSPAPCLSLDVFDTLISRPFYHPSDLFVLLDQPYLALTGTGTAFSSIRMEGEKLARAYYLEKYGYQDITLQEIYAYISRAYQLADRAAEQMMRLERELEKRFCRPRKAGVELLQFAKSIGKRVVLITDMYLDRELIEDILQENHIRGYDSLYISGEERRLKKDGALFQRVLDSEKLEAGQMIHLGDSWQADVEGSRKAGIESYFFPSVREVFENRIQGIQVNHCSTLADKACGAGVNVNKIKENVGFRCMLSIAAGRYFDNPYRTFHEQSDLNIDPWFAGFYALGMHMTGLCRWLDRQTAGEKIPVFLARDGYLPCRIYKYWRKRRGFPDHSIYLKVSRRSLMPYILSDRADFYQPPVSCLAHTPQSLLQLFSFADGGCEEGQWERTLQEKGMQSDARFRDQRDFHAFISLFLKKRYDAGKHEDAKKLIREYLQDLPQEAAAFDLGYSGRVQQAICAASGRAIPAFYIYEDYTRSVHCRKAGRFRISSFYQYVPDNSGLLREYIFSSLEGTCTGYERRGETVEAVCEQKEAVFPENFSRQMLRQGAEDFCREFLDCFGNYIEDLDFSPQAVSLPFEGFLSSPARMDLHMFSASVGEDLVFGAAHKINLEDFAVMNSRPAARSCLSGQEYRDLSADQRILKMIHDCPKGRRALIWVLANPSFFRERLLANLKRRS